MIAIFGVPKMSSSFYQLLLWFKWKEIISAFRLDGPERYADKSVSVACKKNLLPLLGFFVAVMKPSLNSLSNCFLVSILCITLVLFYPTLSDVFFD